MPLNSTADKLGEIIVVEFTFLLMLQVVRIVKIVWRVNHKNKQINQEGKKGRNKERMEKWVCKLTKDSTVNG